MTTATEHPAFTRIKAMPEPWRTHFPKSTDEANVWRPRVLHVALATRVLVVARTRVEGMWCAYIDAVPGMHHGIELGAVLDLGSKLPESFARVLFPQFEGVPYVH